MYAERPVVAVASGGPMESVSNDKTGFLVKDGAKGFASAIYRLVVDPGLALTMGKSGRKDVIDRFSPQIFGAQLEKILQECYARGPAESYLARLARVSCFVFVVVCLLDASYRFTNKVMLAWLWACIPVRWFRVFADSLTE